MIPAEYTPYLSLVSIAFGAAMTVSFWYLRNSQEKKRERHVRSAIGNHVSNLVDILENVYNRAEKAEQGDREAKVACAYFAKYVHRLEALRLSVENLLPELDQDAKYVREVRKILEVESWLIDRYHDPTIPDGKRFHLWNSGVAGLEQKTRNAVDAASSLGIVEHVTIR